MRGKNHLEDNSNSMDNEFDFINKSQSSGMIEERHYDGFDLQESTKSYDPEPVLGKHNSGIVMCSETYNRRGTFNSGFKPSGCDSETTSNFGFNDCFGKNYGFESPDYFDNDFRAVNRNEECMIVEGERLAIATTNQLNTLYYDNSNQTLPNRIQNNQNTNNLENNPYDRNLQSMQDNGDDFYKNTSYNGNTKDSSNESLNREKSIFGCNQINDTKNSSSTKHKLFRHHSNYDSIYDYGDNIYSNFDLDREQENFTIEEILHINDDPNQEQTENVNQPERSVCSYKEDHDMETEMALSETNWQAVIRNGRINSKHIDMQIQNGKMNARQEIFNDQHSIFSEYDANTIYGNVINEVKPKKSGCSCAKSQCLRNYCECFKSNTICGPECNCCGCKNTVENVDSINRLKEQFKPKITISKEEYCTCRHSMCANNYCPCHKNGKVCGPKCACFSCENPINLRRKQNKEGKPFHYIGANN